MWLIGVEVEQETSAPSPKKYPGSAPVPYAIMIMEIKLFPLWSIFVNAWQIQG